VSRKRRFNWPTGTPQIAALLLVLLVDSLVAPHFFQIMLQDGRLFGSPIDILNRAAPVALLAIGMTLVIATGGIDLSVGAVMAIAGATAASMTVAGTACRWCCWRRWGPACWPGCGTAFWWRC
jgi:simple sugar transport system permease protein